MVTRILHPSSDIATLRFHFLGYPIGDFHPRRYQVTLFIDDVDVDSTEIIIHLDWIATGIVDAFRALGLNTSQYGVYRNEALDVMYHIPRAEDFSLKVWQGAIVREVA